MCLLVNKFVTFSIASISCQFILFEEKTHDGVYGFKLYNMEMDKKKRQHRENCVNHTIPHMGGFTEGGK